MNEFKNKIGQYLDVSFSAETLSNHSQDDLRRIRLVNYLSLITMANMLSYAILYCIIDFQLFLHATVFLSISSVLTFLIIIINKQGKYLAAKILLSVLTPFFMSYISTVVFGKALGFQVYLFLAAIIPLFLWNYKQKKYPVIIISFIMIVYVIIQFFPPLFTPKILLPQNYIDIFKLTNVSVCFMAAAAAIITYQYQYRKKEEQLVKQAEELKLLVAHKDKVYSIIAHDLRNPLGSFFGLTELFIEDYDVLSDEQRLEIIHSMNKTSVSLRNLLENLLDWSKMHSGTLKKSLKHLNLRKIADESLSLHKDLIEKKKQNTEIDIDPGLTVYADHHMVSTVFRNLISNAIKFTDPQGKISITAQGNHNKVQVCVKDSGIGLSANDIENLFDIRRMYKISGSRLEKGSGLGLLLCKDFIASHKGRVWVESKKGEGAEFYFTLPKSNGKKG